MGVLRLFNSFDGRLKSFYVGQSHYSFILTFFVSI